MRSVTAGVLLVSILVAMPAAAIAQDTRTGSIAAEQAFTPPSGRERQMRLRDLDDIFARAHRSADGTYRAVAARAVPGRPVGGFRYYGTRPDDPNDVVPHEHRRELRALKVFGAWTNLVDMKAGNTRLLRLGFVFEPWQTVPYVEQPAIGRFEGDEFAPKEWRPRVATAAFLRARDDDTFWAARRVAAFTDEMIRSPRSGLGDRTRARGVDSTG
jgi:hypothetical protein